MILVKVHRRAAEYAGFLTILCTALAVRFYNLTSLPTGFHGDESVAGLEAQRVLREGWIGPYTPLALGQPTGTIHLVAASVALFGNTIFAVRFVSAFVGTLTVVLLYFFLRRQLGVKVAFTGSALFAVMTWHVHFSRIGYPLITWPFCALLAAMALMEAARSHDWRWWAGAGAALGAGVYSYSAHPLFIAITFLFVFYYLFSKQEVKLQRRAQWLGAMSAAFFIVSWSMIAYAIKPEHDFFSHTRTITIFQTTEWLELQGPAAELKFLAGRYWQYWDISCWHPKIPSIGDATGCAPLYPMAFLLLAFVGLVLSLWRQRDPLLVYGACIVLLMPLSFVTTTFELTRRSFAAAPFLAMFAALGIREIVHRSRRLGPMAPKITLAAMAGLAAFVVWQNLQFYFVQTAEAEYQSTEYCEEYTAAVAFMKQLPRGSYVYFASDRWSINYEPRQFLAPAVQGEDRSREFSDSGKVSLQIDRSRGKPVFILLGRYRPLHMELWKRFPGGQVIHGKPIACNPAREPTFIAYIPSDHPLANPGPPPPPF